ncbi:TetR/AcrR family transcriptional regulator [Solwaraspora sp. WMMD1047]|uniref:TetR/AcrR family transcriptional regulator n=1 Tax=Solwaraspora sp. WMMD1047 TaxID=3016102 RepID=UPI002416CE5F|nr:TetR/AcrR family transcriptional regulator [Solwaraspora sp. WMMD1047]MDG4828593.1 TetR/AcrR family transcriptional regulator [Solwaraspora sp. WMMD1047]
MTTEYSASGDPKRSMELLWGIQDRPKRGPKPRLSVERIAAAAIGIADREGLAALSMRRVADDVGVTAMSLYTYLPSKAELVDVMLDTVLGEVPLPTEDGVGWRERLTRIARANRDLYLRHPWLLQVATGRPVLGPNLIAKYDHELAAVDGLGLTDVEMDLVVSLLADYVHGAVRGQIEAAQAVGRTGKTDDEWWAEWAPLLEKVFDAERYPIAARVGAAAGAEYNAPADPTRAFEFGLARLLDGIAAHLPT